MKKLAKCSAATMMQDIGLCRGEIVRHAPVGAIELIGDAAIGHVRAPGDAGRMTADARKYQAHRSATFSSKRVVIAYTPARTGPWRLTPARIAAI